MNTVERIESLRKEIEQKKVILGLDTDILTLKGLKKYSNLAKLTFPKSVENDMYFYRDNKKRFFDITYYDFRDIARYRHVVNKISNEVKKKVFSDVCILTEGKNQAEAVEVLQDYINREYKGLSLTINLVDENEETKIATLVKAIFSRYEKAKITNIISIEHPNQTEIRYSSYDFLMKGRGVGSFHNSYLSLRTIDLMQDLAEQKLATLVYDYLFNKQGNKEIVMDKVSSIVYFDKKEFEEHIDDVFKEIISGEIKAFDFIKVIMAFTLELMLQESFDIQEYESRLKAISGDYAKTYMTKKNIPKKIQSFMDDNNFLAMFDYVEADEDCKVEKLEALSQEFILLSTQMCLPKAKQHSLRFRRLGKMKAAGVYYPAFNTLAVDIDSVESFIHEFFHFVDFDNSILSLNNDFKPLLSMYRDLMEERLAELDEENEIKKQLTGKSKYGLSYYRSNEEAFARMGELYVSEVLGINSSSFGKTNFDKPIHKIVYPKTPELLELIKNYYTKLFISLKEDKELVQF